MEELLTRLAKVYDNAAKKAHVMEETGYPVEKLKKIQLNENLRDKDAGKSQDDRVIDTTRVSKVMLEDNNNAMNFLCGNGYEGKFQFIYLDPPFFSQKDYFSKIEIGERGLISYKTFSDSKIKKMEDYLEYITTVAIFGKKLLKYSGTIAVHLDWHASHYVKVIIDKIFGYENFINEIIWKYKSGGAGPKGFARKHDSILIYSKSQPFKFNKIKEKSYNRDFKPYKFKSIDEYKDEKGWYTMVTPRDVWEIDMVGRTSKERTGYATQKPRKLLKKLIEAFSDEGDLIGDFFMGSGTTFIEAIDLDRKFIGCDNSGLSLKTALKRLENSNCDSHRVDLVYRDEAICGELAYNLTTKNSHVKVQLSTVDISYLERELLRLSKKDAAQLKNFLKMTENTDRFQIDEIIDRIYVEPKAECKLVEKCMVLNSVRELENFFDGIYEETENDTTMRNTNLEVIATDIFGNFYNLIRV